MNSPAPSTASKNDEASRALLAGLLSQFLEAQNSDGGWAFYKGGDSRVEPTCWAVLALANRDFARAEVGRGIDFLKSQQLSDGSWPAAKGMAAGGWVTSLAALTLARFAGNDKFVHAGLKWLSDDYPRDSSRWQKFLKSFSSAKQRASHNDEFRGWGWTPRTASWVEPTSFALMAFAAVGAQQGRLGPGSAANGSAANLSSALARSIAARRAVATGLLYDRMCAGGGWNCGNPRVYGVDGDSLILSTCWALLALRDAPEHANRALSLEWLQKSFETIASPASLAVAQITLEHYGLPVPSARRQLTDFSVPELAMQGTQVVAWAALALDASRAWPTRLHGQLDPSHRTPVAGDELPI
jgi:hypothetical protein